MYDNIFLIFVYLSLISSHLATHGTNAPQSMPSLKAHTETLLIKLEPKLEQMMEKIFNHFALCK